MVRTRPLVSLAILVLLLGAARLPAAAQTGGPTLEQILSAPFPSEMLAAPSGGKLAWVQNARGVRNVWVAEPPEYRGRQVTRATRDDGQAVSGLEWTPDARTLVYLLGSGPNRQGEVPNPTSDPAGVELAIWRVSLDGGEPVKIGTGSGAAVSPKGDAVAFVRGGQIWTAPLDGSREPVQLVKARGGARSLRWSPDGSRLAFVSARGDHSFIGVYTLADKTLHWISPSVDGDSDPVWSPDGRRLAFVRQPTNSRITLFYSQRSGHPWSILVADAATGEAKTVWRAREGTGSVAHPMVAENQLLWGAGDRLVFPWEGDGWLHLYSVSANGETGEATLLTPGDFEIEIGRAHV